MARSLKSGGSSFVELVGMGIVAMPVLLALIDLYFVILGYWWTISNCRLAARAASQGPPNILLRDSPKLRAMNVLNTNAANQGGTVHITQCDVSEVIKTLPDALAGGPILGNVTVNLQVEVIPPFLLKLTVPGQKFVVDATQTCPYTWILQPPPPPPQQPSNYTTGNSMPSNYSKSQ